MTLVERYKEVESKLDIHDREFLAMDLLDSKVNDLLISVEDDSYEKPTHKGIYDFIQDTGFEGIMGEILRRFPKRQIQPMRENY